MEELSQEIHKVWCCSASGHHPLPRHCLLFLTHLDNTLQTSPPLPPWLSAGQRNFKHRRPGAAQVSKTWLSGDGIQAFILEHAVLSVFGGGQEHQAMAAVHECGAFCLL